MPLRFEIYRNGARVNAFTPIGAYAVGPESVPVPGEVIFKDAVLTISRTDAHAIGVGLLWEVSPTLTLHCETTRLQQREKPYVLNVELAPLRLMKIIQKQEDWNLFDFPRGDKILLRLKDAQTLFSQALAALETPAIAAQLADEAHAIAVELSEELALYHADLLLGRRRATTGFVKHIFGVRIDCNVQNPRYREITSASFDYAVLPTSWKMLQPQENVFTAETVDAWIDLLNKKRLPLITGPLINLVDAALPEWMYIWENDFDTFREFAYEHVQKLVQRWRKSVTLWNVVGGVCTNSVFTLTFEQMIELTRMLVSQVKNLLPSARTLITVTQPFGDYHAKNPSSVSPILYAEMAAQSGIPFDGFALELQIGLPRPGHYVRDLFQISSMLDRFSAIGRPVFITCLGAPGRPTADPADNSEGALDPRLAGKWQRPWDAQLQADWMERVYRIALSKPFVESIAWADLADVHQSLPGGGLLDDVFQPKPVFERLQQLRSHFAQWSQKK